MRLALALVLLSVVAEAQPRSRGTRSRFASDSHLLNILSPPGAGYDSTNVALSTTSGVPVTFTRASTATCADSSGAIRSLSANQPCVVDGASLRVRSAVQNLLLWSEDLTAASWSNSNTPTVTANTWDSGLGSNTGETIEDNDAATSEGRNQGISTTTTGSWTASCAMQSGTSSTARFIVTVVGGTGSATCSISGLTTTTSRQTCTITAGAGVTGINLNVVVGADATGTGTIKADRCQLVTGSQPGDYCPTAGTSATCAAETATVPTPAGLSRTEGSACFTIKPSWTGANPSATTARIFLGGNAANTARFLYVNAGATTVRAFDGTSTPEVAAGFVGGTAKRYCTRWSAAQNKLRVENVTAGTSAESVFSTFPAFDATLWVGSADSSLLQADADLNITVCKTFNGCQ